MISVGDGQEEDGVVVIEESGGEGKRRMGAVYGYVILLIDVRDDADPSGGG